MDPLPWRVAWQQALYAAELGFYVTRGGPAAHFTTAAHAPTGPVLADALLRLWHRTHPDPPAVVVDVGAGRGELTTHLLHHLLPAPRSRYSADTGDLRIPRTGRVVAVEVVERPEGLDERIEWVRSPGGANLPDLSRPTDVSRPPPGSRYSADAGDRRIPRTGRSGRLEDALVIAHEWLDVVPCTIAEVDETGALREVLVTRDGRESLGGPVSGADLDWAEAHWKDSHSPGREPGQRIEIGRSRDEAWAALGAQVRSGLLVAVDYGHLASARPRGGTLTAYGRGVRRDPVPDSSCDLTAHVAMDTLAHDELYRQRDLLRELGLRGRTPDVAGAATDPRGYLAALERAAAEAELIAPGGFGDFWWAVRHVGPAHVA